MPFPGPKRPTAPSRCATPKAYSIEKQGVRKMIYQTAWRERGEIRGLVEISMELPDEMPHYIRK